MNVAVIGAGPAGMTAAWLASRAQPVTLFECKPEPGRKLLQTGSGHCNLGNLHLSPEHYHCPDRNWLEAFLQTFGSEDLQALMHTLGIPLRATADGWLYPLSNSAQSVLALLRQALRERDVLTRMATRIEAIHPTHSAFLLTYTQDGQQLEERFERVVLACGSPAWPQAGGTNELLPRLHGYEARPFAPALGPLYGPLTAFSGLQGQRLDVLASLYAGRELLGQSMGNMIFTAQGFNGPAVMNLSALLSERLLSPSSKIEISLNLLAPAEEALQESAEKLLERAGSPQRFLWQIFSPKSADVLLKNAPIARHKLSETPDASQARAFLSYLRAIRFPITGAGGLRESQVCTGGLATSQFSPYTMQSRLHAGLYACGEVLDVCGDCGGYNLHFAFGSGYLAGKSLAVMFYKGENMNIPFIEPFRIKMVERVKMTTREEREEALRKAHFNLFALPAEKVFIDLLTDSGTNAMSDEQWAGIMHGDESYAGARSYYHFESAIQDLLGFPYVLPTHQGRAAEGMLFSTLVKAGQSVPNNRHFDTTMGNLQVLGANPIDLPIAESEDSTLIMDFKGNMDLVALEAWIQATGVQNIPLGMLTITNNSAAGQPVSMDNIRATGALYHKYGIPFFIDACRFGENAWFIKLRDPKYRNTPVLEVVREMFSYADGCTMSAKKDAIVNIGGFVAFRDEALKNRIAANLIVHEGFLTYGGLAGRDLEAMAIGLYEGTDEDYLAYREAHTRYLGTVLAQAGLPVYMPTGGHAVYVDAGKALPHIPKAQFPAVGMSNALYRAGSVRTVEIGSLMFEHKDPLTGETMLSPLELLRFAIPRRVYTRSHLDYIAEAAHEMMKHAEEIRGLRVSWAPQVLRHFMAHLEEV